MCINTLLFSPDASLLIERQREQGVSWWGGYHFVCLCLSPFVLTVREGVLWVWVSTFSVSLFLSLVTARGLYGLCFPIVSLPCSLYITLCLFVSQKHRQTD